MPSTVIPAKPGWIPAKSGKLASFFFFFMISDEEDQGTTKKENPNLRFSEVFPRRLQITAEMRGLVENMVTCFEAEAKVDFACELLLLFLCLLFSCHKWLLEIKPAGI
jgi:hypothetical protein